MMKKEFVWYYLNNKIIFLHIYIQFSMRKIRQLREEILKKDYLNSDIMKITEAISKLDDTDKKLSKDKKMQNGEKYIIINQEVKNIQNLIVAYTKKSKTIPLEIQQLEITVHKFLKDIVLKLNKVVIL